MIYYIKETQNDENHKKTAGVKARADLEQIFEDCLMEQIKVPSIEDERAESNSFKKIQSHFKVAGIWKESVSHIKNGDAVILQFPAVEHSILLFKVIKMLKKRGVRIILFIHDLELFRYTKHADYTLKRRLRLYLEETSVLRCADVIVAHNTKMKEALCSRLNIDAHKIVVLDIFDYLIPDFNESRLKKRGKSEPVIISGNLHPQKAGYAYDLPENAAFNLYGVNYQNLGSKNIRYMGSFSSEEIPFAMEGSFGLVWDGPSGETCEGPFGEYLKINNPHKTSLYLASGIPVIIWEEAALTDYVRTNNVGITVRSLEEIDEKLSALSDEEYEKYRKNAVSLSENLRAGSYTRTALKALGLIGDQQK